MEVVRVELPKHECLASMVLLYGARSDCIWVEGMRCKFTSTFALQAASINCTGAIQRLTYLMISVIKCHIQIHY